MAVCVEGKGGGLHPPRAITDGLDGVKGTSNGSTDAHGQILHLPMVPKYHEFVAHWLIYKGVFGYLFRKNIQERESCITMLRYQHGK